MAKLLVYVRAALFLAVAWSGTALGQCYDCQCNSDGVWEAWDPEAIGHWSGGRSEPGINVRRCAALNDGATGGVCRQGTYHNIYTSPAPAITSPRCQIVVGPDPGDDDDGDNDDGDGVDRYSQVKALFDAADAVAPTIEEMSAFWSGRCYREDSRSNARGGISFVRRHNGDDGPLFPGNGDPKLYVFEHTSSANAFDDLTNDEIATINGLVTDDNDLVTPVTNVDNALSSYYLPQDQTPIQWRVRKVVRDTRPYYVTAAALARSSGSRPQGYVFMACYHYMQSRTVNP